MTSVPFWPAPAERYPGRLPERADVLVIGGGIAGVSLLHHLAHRGMDAVLVERKRLASGASGRNAGFLLAGVASSYEQAIHAYGRHKAREIWGLTNENHDRLVEAVDGQFIGHRREGSATLAASDAERLQLEESAQLLTEDGFKAHWNRRRRRLTNPRDGEVNPAALVGALARLAKRGCIREGVNVTGLEPGGSEVMVKAGQDECRAGVVILATNAYTPLLVPSIKIVPNRAQMLATAMVPTPVCDMPTYSHFGYRYWRQLASGQVLIGGWRDTSLNTEIGYLAEPTEQIQGHLDAKLAQLAPGAQVTHRWAGTMGFTETGLPLVGPVDGMANVHVCAGFNGHGMGFAFMSAKQLVDSL